MRQPRLSNRHNQVMSCPAAHQPQPLSAHMSTLIRSSKSRAGNHRAANVIRASEYRNLRQVVPSLRRQRDLGKVEVVTEAAKYIDHLHKSLIKRFVACGIPESLKDVLGTDDANELNSQHIMNLVTQMAAKQRAGQRAQQQSISAISSSRTNQQHQMAPPQLSPLNQVTSVANQTITTAQRRALPVPATKRCVAELTCFKALE